MPRLRQPRHLHATGIRWLLSEGSGGPFRKGALMKRSMKAVVAAAVVSLPCVVTAPASASTQWICTVPNVGDVVFVTAADAARHGIDTADAHAGQTFKDRFGEQCRVVST